MYVPSAFDEPNTERMHDFIESHSFATLVSNNGSEPFVSHMPLLLDREFGKSGRLVGHLARANPQWKHAAGQRVLAVFSGPHAYISPAWLDAVNVVPTWNYLAVHAVGVLRLEEDRSQVLEIVRRYVESYESSRSRPWSLDEPEADFIDKLLDAIVGFTIEIESLQGKWKLNQNHTEERRIKVIEALRENEDANSRQIADLMSDTLD